MRCNRSNLGQPRNFEKRKKKNRIRKVRKWSLIYKSEYEFKIFVSQAPVITKWLIQLCGLNWLVGCLPFARSVYEKKKRSMYIYERKGKKKKKKRKIKDLQRIKLMEGGADHLWTADALDVVHSVSKHIILMVIAPHIIESFVTALNNSHAVIAGRER